MLVCAARVHIGISSFVNLPAGSPNLGMRLMESTVDPAAPPSYVGDPLKISMRGCYGNLVSVQKF